MEWYVGDMEWYVDVMEWYVDVMEWYVDVMEYREFNTIEINLFGNSAVQSLKKLMSTFWI